jgi:hypothetical protein
MTHKIFKRIICANTQKIKSVIVNFGIFFDGTNNQRLQVAGMIRRNKESGKKVVKIKKKIEDLGGTFDEEQFKMNRNIQYHSCQLRSLETPMYKGLSVSDF